MFDLFDFFIGPGVDGEQLRPGENDIVFKLGIDKGLDVLFCAPSGRSVFLVPAIFARLFRLGIDHQPQDHGPRDPHQPIKGVEPWGKVGKGRTNGPAQPYEFMGEVRALGQPVGRADLQKCPQEEQVGQVGQKNLFDVTDLHAPPPLPIPAPAGAAAAHGPWPF